jgi:hypothetical protein
MEKKIEVFLAVIGILGLIHTVNWLTVKGIIFVVNGIFSYSLHSKFWYLYVGTILISLTFKPRK